MVARSPPGEQQAGLAERRLDRRGHRGHDPPQADAGHAEPVGIDFGPGREPGRGSADVANPLPHGEDRALDVGREEPLVVPLPASARHSTELHEEGGDPLVGQSRGEVAGEGEVGPEDVQTTAAGRFPGRLGRKYSAWMVLLATSGVTIGEENRTAETVNVGVSSRGSIS